MVNLSIHSVEEIAKNNPKIQEMLKQAQNMPEFKCEIQQKIEKIISIFQQYDKIQLLGGLSLTHLPKVALSDEHVPMLEKLIQEAERICNYSSCGFGLDPTPQDKMSSMLDQLGYAVPKLENEFLGMEMEEDWETIMEYALSFSSSVKQNGSEIPSHDVISQLYALLKDAKDSIAILEMNRSGSYEEDSIKFFSHLTTIGIRGDGYPQFIEDVFRGLFGPHDNFFITKYGFSTDDVFNLVEDLEKRIYSKIRNYIGFFFSWLRFRRWHDDLKKGNTYIVDNSIKKDLIFDSFFQCNPDMIPTKDSKFGSYDSKDIAASSMIFWITPNSIAEKKILSIFSLHMGGNSSFIQDGEFKGFITNESLIYTKPFVQENNRFYCFSHYLPYVQLFEMMEYLLKQDPKYYDQNYQQNQKSISRDKYFETKVTSVFKKFLPNVCFYNSTHYKVKFEECPKEPELDILGMSDLATYIIEVKAHELSHKDKIRIKGLKDKVKDAVNNALHQCERCKKHILNEDGIFNTRGDGSISVDKKKPIYKIIVTFQQFTMFLTDCESYKKMGIIDSSIDDTFVVSLFDLMAILDNMNDENELIRYLEIRKEVNRNKLQYFDELDLFGYFKEGMLDKAAREKGVFITPIQPSKLDEKYLGKKKIQML